ncbi:class II fructose-bisphosphate aldolase [Lachnospiraceae bacterium 62-35]
MLVRMDILTQKAAAERYGIAAPCPLDFECVKWCFEAAERLHAPLIICYHAWKNTGMSAEELAFAVKYYEKKHSDVPVGLCLDHGRSYEDAARAIKAGFTGVMVDRSDLSDFENAEAILEAVQMAHEAGVSVEAALGGAQTRDASLKQREETLTNIESARLFVDKTGIDALAVAVGSYHGDIKSDAAVIHFDLIASLKKTLSATLTMHGCSFLGNENLKKSAKNGISKFNVQGELLNAGMEAAKAELLGQGGGSAADLNKAIKEGYISQLIRFMTHIGSASRW